MPKHKQVKLNFEGLLDNLIDGIIENQQNITGINIISFVEEILFNGKGKLFPTQKALLKIFYNLELTEEDFVFINKWASEDRTTFLPGRKYKNLVLEGGRRSSKCFAPSTLLFSKEKGMIYGYELLEEIISIQNKSFAISKQEGLKSLEDKVYQKPLTLAIEGKEKTAQSSNFYIKGQSYTKKIVTACGYELEATPEHRIKVIDTDGNINWRYFKDIKVGEYACIHRATNLFPTNYIWLDDYQSQRLILKNKPVEYKEYLNKDWGLLLGLLVGNGSWTNSKGITCTFHSQDYSFYIDIFDRTLKPEANNLNLYVFNKKESKGATIGISSVHMRELFKNLGFIVEVDSKTKKIPWSIRCSPKDVQAAFLCGLFASDGYLGKGGREVSLSTASKFLAQEVQLMLLNFGIVSKVTTRIVNGAGKGKEYYWVILRGKRSLIKFAEEITFGLSRKQDPLVKCISESSRDGGDTERIPYQKEWLQKIRESLPTNIGQQPGSHHGAGRLLGTSYTKGKEKLRNLRIEFRKIVGNAIKENSEELLSSYRLDKILNFAEEFSNNLEAINHFNYLKDCDYFYDPIISVEDSEAFCVDLTVPGEEQYVAQGFTNHNSTTCSFIILYEFYKLITLEDPAVHYNLLPSSPIHILIFSQTFAQVKETLYAQVKGYAENCNYFKNLEKKGFINILGERIDCPSKNIAIYPKHTKNTESLVGYAIKVLALDEASRFEFDEFGVCKADDIYLNVGRACRTFGDEGYKIAISSAWEENDYIQQLYELSKKDPSTIGFRFRTWDLNLSPHLSEQSLRASDDYIKDPITAALEYEGIRSIKRGQYLISENIEAAFSGISAWDANYEALDILPQDNSDDIRHYVGVNITRLEQSKDSSFLHVDYGFKKDSAALACCHTVKLDNGNLAIQVDGFLVWKPFTDVDSNNIAFPRVVSFLDVEDKIIQISRARNVIKCSFDQYNSQGTIQRLHMIGINTIEMSSTNEKQAIYYSVTKQLMDQGLLILPRDNTWTPTAKLELLNLIQYPNGRIDHPNKNSSSVGKDIADAIVNCVYNCFYNTVSMGNNLSFNNNLIKTVSSKVLGQVSNSTTKELKRKNALKVLKSAKSKNIF